MTSPFVIGRISLNWSVHPKRRDRVRCEIAPPQRNRSGNICAAVIGSVLARTVFLKGTGPTTRYSLFMGEAPCAAAITIRQAVSEDADSIARTFQESAEYHAYLDQERYWIPPVETISARYREGRQHAPAGGEGITLVAELNGEIVGFIDARLDRSTDPMHREILYCHVVEIAVSRRHQHQGIGGQLLRAAEDWGRRHGAEFASLEYLAANTQASVFYQRHMGYRVASTMAIKRL